MAQSNEEMRNSVRKQMAQALFDSANEMLEFATHVEDSEEAQLVKEIAEGVEKLASKVLAGEKVN